MRKYIDTEELLKEASKDGAYGYVSAEQIADFHAADVQEVVRCGECVNWNEDFQYNTCALFGGRWNENMFCWYGERKDG